MYSKGSWWIGLLTFSGIGSLATLIIYEMGRKLGTDYVPLKGAFTGLVNYGLVAAIFGTLAKNPKFAELSVTGHYVQASVGFWGGFWAL